MNTNKTKPQSEMNAIDRNIAAVHEVRTRADAERSVHETLVVKFVSLVSSPLSLYTHLSLYGFWAAIDLWHSASLNTIGQVASLESIFLAIFVLMNQRRMNTLERKNSDLHLQMSLLAEHEVTKLTQVVDLIAKTLKVNISSIDDLENAKKEIEPGEVLERIAEHERENLRILQKRNHRHQNNKTKHLKFSVSIDQRSRIP